MTDRLAADRATAERLTGARAQIAAELRKVIVGQQHVIEQILIALLAGGLYVPVEIYELIRHPSWMKVFVLTTNLAVVAYMAWALLHVAEQAKELAGDAKPSVGEANVPPRNR